MIDMEQAQQAFGDPGQILLCEMTHKGYGFPPGRPGYVNLARLDRRGDDYWRIHDPLRLRDILERTDLTLRRGRPLVAEPDPFEHPNPELIAIATGPPFVLGQAEISAARFDPQWGVLLRTREGQPDWWLLEAWVADPFSGSTDAKSSLARLRAEADPQAD